MVGGIRPALTPEQRDQVRRIRLDYDSSQHVEPDVDGGEPHIALWSVTANVVEHDEDESWETPIGTMAIAQASVWQRGLLDAFDALGGDLFTIAEKVLDPRRDDIDERLEDMIEGTSPQMLILDRVELVPEWRGHGLGPFLAGLAIERLTPHGSFVATIPAPPLGELDGAARQQVIQKLCRTWGSLGFEQFTDEVWVLDLATVALSEALDGYRAAFGLG